MVQTFRDIHALLTPEERRVFWGLVAMSLVMGLLEAAGVVSIVPFIALATNPEGIGAHQRLVALAGTLGLRSTNAILTLVGIGVFFVLVGGIVFRAATFNALTRFARLQSVSLGTRLLQSYLGQPYATLVGRSAARLSNAILTEVDQVVRESIVKAMQLLAHGFLTLCLVAVLIVADPVAAIAIGGLLALSYGGVFMLARRRLARLGQERLKASRQRAQTVHEAFAAIGDVKLLHLEPVYVRRFETTVRHLATVRARAMLIGDAPGHTLQALVYGAMILFVLWSLWRSEGGLNATLPTLGLYAFACMRLFPVLQSLYSGYAAMRAGRPALDALKSEILALPAATATEAEPPSVALPCTRDIVLDDVVFGFPGGDRPILDGLDLKIAAHTTIGIVGTTGAGKTTAIEVILGLLAPQAGRLCVDGVPIAQGTVRAWQKAVGYVPQSIVLVDDSIAANIAFGVAPEAVDAARIEEAARIANIHGFVAELADGYRTRIGEGGMRLSGGQRQRIGIARALYRDPQVLVFDEATSALDTVTEQAVLEAVKLLGRRKTIIMVAHRLSAVRHCERICFMANGRAADIGTYEELLARNSSFLELHRGAL